MTPLACPVSECGSSDTALNITGAHVKLVNIAEATTKYYPCTLGRIRRFEVRTHKLGAINPP
jgi:hypothetical protein